MQLQTPNIYSFTLGRRQLISEHCREYDHCRDHRNIDMSPRLRVTHHCQQGTYSTV